METDNLPEGNITDDDPLAVLGPEGERELKRERRIHHEFVTAFFVVLFLLLEYLTGDL
jgi:hypothetical protein